MEGPLYQQADLRDSIFNEVNADLTRRCENALDLAALAVLHAVSVLIDRSSHPNLEIFRIFEEAISILTERMVSLKRSRISDRRSRYRADDGASIKTSLIRARHKIEDEMAERENYENTSALLELHDIEDELGILKHLFEEQEEQINVMLAIYNNNGSSDSTASTPVRTYAASGTTTSTSHPAMTPLTNNGRVFLHEALAKLKSYTVQVEDIIRRLQVTRHDFDELLQTVQRLAQIDEARLSRQKADLAGAQNRAVMIFTVFTVIFLPLSFFTSLFGMNTYEWGGDHNLRLLTIGSIALPASALLITLALVVAWSSSVRKAFGKVKGGGRRFKKRTVRWWKERILALSYDSDGVPKFRLVGQKPLRGRELLEAKRKRLKRRMKREMTVQDSWERHREAREMLYEIPWRNRRVTGKKASTASKARQRAKVKKENEKK